MEQLVAFTTVEEWNKAESLRADLSKSCKIFKIQRYNSASILPTVSGTIGLDGSSCQSSSGILSEAFLHAGKQSLWALRVKHNELSFGSQNRTHTRGLSLGSVRNVSALCVHQLRTNVSPSPNVHRPRTPFRSVSPIFIQNIRPQQCLESNCHFCNISQI